MMNLNKTEEKRKEIVNKARQRDTQLYTLSFGLVGPGRRHPQSLS